MANLHDYVLWRGDLTFDMAPVNEVDDLLLSQLAYVSFGPFVPGMGMFPQFVTLKAAAERLLEYDSEGMRIHQHAFMWKNIRKLLELSAASRRFGDIQLCAYVDELSKDTQFAALCMRLQNGVHMIAFRGTDDSIAGWKEDLLMALDDPIPAQMRAAEYVRSLGPHLEGQLMLTGHSKGGNLAVFAAAAAPCDVQVRILRVATLDGPGFSRGLLESKGYANIREKLYAMLPESSVVGRLLEQDANVQVVRSAAHGIFQHDAFSWQVRGAALLRADKMTAYSEYLNVVIRSWLDELSTEQRREFLAAVFDMFADVDARTLGEAPAAVFGALPQIVRKMSTLEKERKDQVIALMRKLGEAAIHGLRGTVRTREKALPPHEDDPL